MKMIEEVKRDLFNEKVLVELSLAEILTIHCLVGGQSTNSIKKLLGDRGFKDVAEKSTENNDLSILLYKGSSEILGKKGVLR